MRVPKKRLITALSDQFPLRLILLFDSVMGEHCSSDHDYMRSLVLRRTHEPPEGLLMLLTAPTGLRRSSHLGFW